MSILVRQDICHLNNGTYAYMPPTISVLSTGMKTSKRPYVAPKGSQTYQLARAIRILKGRQDGVTFEALAQHYGVTATRIQQIYWHAVRRGWPKCPGG
jgi:hypothetical protein